MKNALKKIKQFLIMWDGVWSVPVAIFIFLAVGQAIVSWFGPEAGMMLPVYMQRLFYAALCMVIANFVVLFGLYMNFRGWFNWYDTSITQTFTELPAKTKIILFLVMYGFYFLGFIFFLIFV